MTTVNLAKSIHAARHAVGGADYVAPAVVTTAWTSGSLVVGVNTVDATAGAKTPALPTPTAVGQILSVEKTDATTNTVTISGTIRGAGGSVVLQLSHEAVMFEAESLTSWRPFADHKTLSSLDARYDAAGVGLAKASNLSDLPNAATARTNLGLGSAATVASSAFDAAGAAGVAQAAAIAAAATDATTKVAAESTSRANADALLAPLASPALTGSPTIGGKRAKAERFHNTLTPNASFAQFASGRVACGVDAALGKMWSYNSGGLYQSDALTSGAFVALTLPTNINPSGKDAKVVTYTPPSGANSGVKQMFMISWNTSTTKYEIYSAVPGLKTVAPTWSSLLQAFQTNAVLIPTAFRATSGAIFAGEYTGASDISGNIKVYRSVDGITWSTVLSIASGSGASRHIHGIYEDPFNLGTIYVQVGDFFSPYTPPFSMYKSTDGGATFTGVPGLTVSTWQAVSMGFTADWIWCLSDQSAGAGPFLLDRATLTPRWASTKARQDNIAVPMGIGGRQVADMVINSTTTITSATAAFTTADVGRAVMGNNSLLLGAYIVSVTNATTAVISAAATSSQSGQSLIIGGDQFYAVAYAGAIDPASGWLYLVANDSSNFGNVAGIFVMTGPDEPMLLLRTLPLAAIGSHEVYIAGGYLYVDRYGPMPLLTAL